MKRNRLAIFCNELASIRCITDAASRHFELIWTQDAKSLRMAVEKEPAPTAVLVDNALAKNAAIDLLEQVRQARPDTARILLTDYCDLSLIVAGLHTGAVQKIVYKPIHPAELLSAVGPPALTMAMASQVPGGRQVGRAAG